MLVFTHIPRTGGTTIRSILSRYLENRTFIDSFSGFSFMTDSELNGNEFIATHCGYGIFNRINKEHKRLVVLRDPVERIVSHYYYLRDIDENISYSSYYAKNLPLIEFIKQQNPAVQTGINNTQTWHLIKDKNQSFRNQYKGMAANDLVDIALEHLQKYNFIGFTDSLPFVIDQLVGEYGSGDSTNDIPLIAKSNRPQLANIDQEILNEIRDIVDLDCLLFERARQVVSIT